LSDALTAATVEFESLFDVVAEAIGYPASAPPSERSWSRAPTGDAYVTLTGDGIKAEGEPLRPFPTEESAIAAWFDAAKAYASGRCGTLYWRQRPEIAVIHARRGKAWLVYSRIFVPAVSVLAAA